MLVANSVLFLWPVVALILFSALGREKGLIWTVVAGYLLLPEHRAMKLPLIPDYEKLPVISYSVMLGALFFRHKLSWPNQLTAPAGGTRDRFGLVLAVLLAMVLIGAFITTRDNGYPLIDADRIRIGMSFRDYYNMISEILISMVPFFIAWRWLRAPEHHEELLRVIVIMALIYSLAAVYEMRMSPQINRLVYDFFPHAWLQHVRGGEFRPVVFLRHGLWLAFFLLTAVLAAFGLFRARNTGTERMFYLGAGLWILLVLLVSPNLGAAMLAIMFAPLVLFSPRAIQVRIATGVAVVFLAYPAVRQADYLPMDSFLEFVSGISEARAQSLQFRFDNEDDLLARAAEKPIFGWGSYGRWRVIDEKGRDTTVSDGLWIISLGERGWVGYIGQFGILTIPLLALARARRKKGVSPATTTMALIVAANLIYLIPNSALSAVGWLLAGSLAGYISWRPVPKEEAEAAAVVAPEPGVRFTRFKHAQRSQGPAVALRRDPGTFAPRR